MKASHGFVPTFNEENLISHAGLAPALILAERAGLTALVNTHLTVDSPNTDVKVRTMLAGMLTGADSIDDLDVLRSGSTERVIGEVRAPSTMGTHLRSYTHGHVRQISAISRRFLTNLTTLVPGLIGSGMVMLDLDDTIREVHGHKKQSASYGYSKVRGLNALVAAVSTETSAPVITDFSLRRGNIRSGKSAATFMASSLNTISDIAPGQQVLVRADSAFCTRKNVAAAIRAGAWFSVTTQAWKTVTDAYAGIADDAWTAIKYPQAIYDEDTERWISDAEVAETPFVAFSSKTVKDHISCRLVVRRVKNMNPKAHTGQEPLFDTWRYHAFITDSTLTTVEADRWHRRHAIIEQVIAELKAGPLNHLPSGKFHANSAWLAFSVLSFNLSRAAAVAAGMPKIRMQTLRHRLISVPARLASSARRTAIKLSARWPWQTQWARLWNTAAGPPIAHTN